MYTLMKKNIIKAPIDGYITLLEDVPDPAFADGMLGEGIAICAIDTNVVAPCSGVITMIAHTKHAIGITNEDGIEILIHLGIDTVELKGNGFELLVNTGDIVTVGTPLINIDPTLINNQDKSFFVPIIICNYRVFKLTQMTDKKVVEAGVHTIFEYERK